MLRLKMQRVVPVALLLCGSQLLTGCDGMFVDSISFSLLYKTTDAQVSVTAVWGVRPENISVTPTMPPSATSLFETREFDPNLWTPASSPNDRATVTLELDNGQTITYSQHVVLDASTSVQPITSGHQVAVYRSSDPAALQAFINQYSSSVVAVNVESSVSLQDVYAGGSTVTSPIEGQVGIGSETLYLGSVNSRVRPILYQEN